MLKIKNIILPDKPLILAPMEDVTDLSFRLICKEYGADLMFTEFIASEALVRNIDKTLKKMTVLDVERPVGIQIYGHNVENMVLATKMALEYKPDLIDINCGCPVKKIATRGDGAGLLQTPDLMVKIAQEVVKAAGDTPVTLKTRLGWDENSKIIYELSERLQDTGIQALTIHGRTRCQLYTGTADWTLIGKVKNNPRMYIPIIGNGDVDSPQKAKEMFDTYGVDGVMIGRASVGTPWIFKTTREFLNTGVVPQEPSVSQRVELCKRQIELGIKYKGHPRAILEMRRHYSQYFKGLPDFKDFRVKLVTLLDKNEIFDVLDQVNEKYQQ